MMRNEISNGGRSIIGGAGLATWLLGMGLENKGYPEYVALPVGCIGITGVGLAVISALGFSWRRTSVTRTVDTVLTKRPAFVVVLDGERVIAPLYPDDNGIAEFPVREYLQSLPDTIHDLRLTVRTRPDTLSRSFLLPKGAVIQAREELRAERARQAREERERREAEERERKEERERQARAAAALDNVVASLSTWERAELVTRFMYANAGFQYLVARGNVAKALGISSYGEFLNLPLRSQVWAVRELARATCGEGQGLQASLFLQELLHMPAYLAEKMLR